MAAAQAAERKHQCEENEEAMREENKEAMHEENEEAMHEENKEAMCEENEEAMHEENEEAMHEENKEAMHEENEEAMCEENEEAMHEENEEAMCKENEEAMREENEEAMHEENKEAMRATAKKITMLARPKGEAGSTKKGFNLHKAMGLNSSSDKALLYNEIMVHQHVTLDMLDRESLISDGTSRFPSIFSASFASKSKSSNSIPDSILHSKMQKNWAMFIEK